MLLQRERLWDPEIKSRLPDGEVFNLPQQSLNFANVTPFHIKESSFRKSKDSVNL
jgi:hypothetical protein